MILRMYNHSFTEVFLPSGVQQLNLFRLNKMKKFLFSLSCYLMLISLACTKDDTAKELEMQKKAALEQYANLVLSNYDDCYQTVQVLKDAVNAFLANPTATGFEACKTAWLQARIPYGQSEAFRFYGGPIDDLDGPEGLINAWPLDENYVDYVASDPMAGIINQPQQYPEITKELLSGLNEAISETSIFTGYHAAEFLLWGQDFNTAGPGARPYTDFVQGAGGTASHQNRRAQYLQIVIELLLENLEEVRVEWRSGGEYRRAFLENFETSKAIGLIFAGLGEFSKGEISGERMFVAVDVKDQEHEHSCFSDNTHQDLKMNLLGIRNVYFGAYVKVDGTSHSGQSFAAIAASVDAVKAQNLQTAFDEATAKVNAIPTPFDQTILNNPTPILDAIDAMRTLSDRLQDVGLALGGAF
jgi:putative iron-regulated protein